MHTTWTTGRVAHIFRRDPRSKGRPHKLIHLRPHLWRQIPIRIIFIHIERKLGPNAKMDNALIDAIRPVIIDDFDII